MTPSKHTWHIRRAAAQDMAAVAEIYNHAVRHTLAIWREDEVDEAERRNWLAQHEAAGFPVLVAADDANNVLGYASYNAFRHYPGYRYTVENSVYVATGAQGAGIGRALMEALLHEARSQGLHVMVAGIEAGNTASVRLHEKLGFVQTGLMPQVGIKFGKWLDLLLMQKNVQE